MKTILHFLYTKPILLLNVFSVSFFGAIYFFLRIPLEETLMFSTPDSKTYLEVANWIEKGIETKSLLIRPFLYPFLLLFLKKIGGVFFIFLVQFIFWLLSINFTFFSIKKLTNNILISFLGAFSMIVNVSYIALTFHALTEVFSTFLLSFLIYFVANNFNKISTARMIIVLLLFFVSLTLIKPLFSIPLYFLIGLIIFLFLKRRIPKRKGFFILFVLIFSPLIFQINIVFQRNNQFAISVIGRKTLVDYYVAQGIQLVENVDKDKARLIANKMSTQEMLIYLYAHKEKYKALYFLNLRDNIAASPIYIYYGGGNYLTIFETFMLKYNRVTFSAHFFMLIVSFIYLSFLFKAKENKKAIVLSAALGLNHYLILTSGISFNQGDRLVLPSIAIWSVLYFSIIYLLVKRLKWVI